MLSHLGILAVFPTIQDFYQSHKDIINNLVSGSLPAIISAGVGFMVWLKRQNPKRRTTVNTFAFEVIEPQNRDLKKQIYGGKYDDSLADHNIPYQQRVANRNIRSELQQILEEHRWLLILGRTGIGKTREAVELAERYKNLGWTVFYFKLGEWLDVPARMPEEFGTERKLLFLLDNLNRKMYRSNEERNPKAEESLSEPLNVALQERLLNTLEKYEKFCGKAEILVIATARNEKESQFEGEPSPWEQLQWEKYPKLWQRFTVYDLPEPSDDAIVDVLAATISNTDITPKPEHYAKIASSNDRTFRNVVENLRRLENDGLPLNPSTYLPSSLETWEKRYQEAVKRYPATKCIYDAVDLLSQFDISLEKFIIEPTANLMVKGNIWQRLQYRFKIRSALNYLVEIERIENPRDGQIEAKGYQVEAGEYIPSLSNLVFKIIDKYPQEIESSLKKFGSQLERIECYKEAIAYYDKALEMNPSFEYGWSGRGYVLFSLNRYEEAIYSYDKALKINPSSESTWNNRGFILKVLNRYEEAVESYDQALIINPSSDFYWNNRASVLCSLNRYEEAIESYDKALEINPLLFLYWYNRGLILYELKRYKEAVESYDKALENDPSLEYIWNDRGNALSELKRYEEAIASYDKALKINPLSEHIWYYKGNALNELKRYEEAIASYDKALKINPSYEYAWNNRGSVLIELKRYEEAIISYDKALEIDPLYESAWNNRGYTLSELNRYEEAIASYDKALEINPSSEYYWYYRGNALSYLNRYEEAIASYDKALEINPSSEYNWYVRGNALSYLNHYEEEITSYDKALEINPAINFYWYNRGIALSYLKRYEEAIYSYDKALEIDPLYESAWYDRGNALSYLNRYEEAIASYDKALEINSSSESYWNNRGNALIDLKCYEEAIASYDKALEINPAIDFYWNNRGIALSYLKRYEEAIASYNKALEINPLLEDDWDFWYGIARYYALEGNIDLALENLEKAISLNSECCEDASTDSMFDQIRSDERFKALIGEE